MLAVLVAYLVCTALVLALMATRHWPRPRRTRHHRWVWRSLGWHLLYRWRG